MALGLVLRQNCADLLIQGAVAVGQPLGQILMYGRFTDAEVLRGRADGGAVFDDVHSQITGSLFDVLPHVSDPL